MMPDKYENSFTSKRNYDAVLNALFATGDASSRIPLEATLVMTAVLAPGANATDASPALLEVREAW